MKIYERLRIHPNLWHYECNECCTVFTQQDTVREYFSNTLGKFVIEPDRHEMNCPFCGKKFDIELAEIVTLPEPVERGRKKRGWVRPKHVPRTIVQPERSHGFTIEPQIDWDRFEVWIEEFGLPCPIPPKEFF